MKIKWSKRKLALPKVVFPKLTFLIIPEANRTVRRFRIPYLLLYAIPMIIMMIICISLILYTLQLKNTETISALSSQANAQSEQIHKLLNDRQQVVDQMAADKHQAVAAKNQTIEKLQIQVIELSNQADAMMDKVTTLEELGSQIGINIPEKSTDEKRNVVSIAGYDSDSADDSHQPEPLNASDNAMITSMTTTVLNRSLQLLPELDHGHNRPSGAGGESIWATDNDIIQLSHVTQDNLSSLDEDINLLVEQFSIEKTKQDKAKQLKAITPSIWPVGYRKISSGFGYRKDPFNGKASFHSGIDIAAPTGTRIYVTADGKVTATGYDRERGNYIMVNHGNGIRTEYMHLSKILVKTGKSVSKGDNIGLVGSTGRSTGPHLHYQVYKNGVIISPKPYLP